MAYLTDEASIGTEARALINEPTALFFSATEITNWILQGVVDVACKSMCYEKSATLTMVENQLEYDEPTSCIWVYACFYEYLTTPVASGLIRIHPRMIAHMSGGELTGLPRFYYHFAGKIGLYPRPSSTYAARTVRVLYSTSTSDITYIPDEYKHIVALYVVWKAKLKEGKFAQAAQIMAMYLNQIMFHRQDLFERPSESKDMLKIPDRTVIAQ